MKTYPKVTFSKNNQRRIYLNCCGEAQYIGRQYLDYPDEKSDIFCKECGKQYLLPPARIDYAEDSAKVTYGLICLSDLAVTQTITFLERG